MSLLTVNPQPPALLYFVPEFALPPAYLGEAGLAIFAWTDRRELVVR